MARAAAAVAEPVAPIAPSPQHLDPQLLMDSRHELATASNDLSSHPCTPGLACPACHSRFLEHAVAAVLQCCPPATTPPRGTNGGATTTGSGSAGGDPVVTTVQPSQELSEQDLSEQDLSEQDLSERAQALALQTKGCCGVLTVNGGEGLAQFNVGLVEKDIVLGLTKDELALLGLTKDDIAPPGLTKDDIALLGLERRSIMRRSTIVAATLWLERRPENTAAVPRAFTGSIKEARFFAMWQLVVEHRGRRVEPSWGRFDVTLARYRERNSQLVEVLARHVGRAPLAAVPCPDFLNEEDLKINPVPAVAKWSACRRLQAEMCIQGRLTRAVSHSKKGGKYKAQLFDGDAQGKPRVLLLPFNDERPAHQLNAVFCATPDSFRWAYVLRSETRPTKWNLWDEAKPKPLRSLLEDVRQVRGLEAADAWDSVPVRAANHLWDMMPVSKWPDHVTAQRLAEGTYPVGAVVHPFGITLKPYAPTFGRKPTQKDPVWLKADFVGWRASWFDPSKGTRPIPIRVARADHTGKQLGTRRLLEALRAYDEKVKAKSKPAWEGSAPLSRTVTQGNATVTTRQRRRKRDEYEDTDSDSDDDDPDELASSLDATSESDDDDLPSSSEDSSAGGPDLDDRIWAQSDQEWRPLSKKARGKQRARD